MTPGYYLVVRSDVPSTKLPKPGEYMVVEVCPRAGVKVCGCHTVYGFDMFKDYVLITPEVMRRIANFVIEAARYVAAQLPGWINTLTEQRITLDVAAKISGVGALTNENYQRFWVGDEEHQLHVDAARTTTLLELHRWKTHCSNNGRDFC